MKNLIKKIEKIIVSLKRQYQNCFKEIDCPLFTSDEIKGKISAYQDCLNLLNQYNIITAPKQIKLSEIVEKLKNNYSYDNITIERNSTYTRIIGRTQHHLYSTTETLFDIDFNKTLDKPNFHYKWLYTLWIAGTIIEDDLECDE